uniref:A-kinase anchor protein 4 n=1 Tax=Anthurium amnicola TaxID=1678845 RepID=A0A1D1YKP3_9ARAE
MGSDAIIKVLNSNNGNRNATESTSTSAEGDVDWCGARAGTGAVELSWPKGADASDRDGTCGVVSRLQVHAVAPALLVAGVFRTGLAVTSSEWRQKLRRHCLFSLFLPLSFYLLCTLGFCGKQRRWRWRRRKQAEEVEDEREAAAVVATGKRGFSGCLFNSTRTGTNFFSKLSIVALYRTSADNGKGGRKVEEDRGLLAWLHATYRLHADCGFTPTDWLGATKTFKMTIQ